MNFISLFIHFHMTDLALDLVFQTDCLICENTLSKTNLENIRNKTAV